MITNKMNMVIIRSDQGMDQCIVLGILLPKRMSSVSPKSKWPEPPAGDSGTAEDDSFGRVGLPTIVRTSSPRIQEQQWTVTNSQEDMCIHRAGRRKNHEYFETTMHIA